MVGGAGCVVDLTWASGFNGTCARHGCDAGRDAPTQAGSKRKSLGTPAAAPAQPKKAKTAEKASPAAKAEAASPGKGKEGGSLASHTRCRLHPVLLFNRSGSRWHRVYVVGRARDVVAVIAGAIAEYEKTLSKFLKANGPAKMAVIGSQVINTILKACGDCCDLAVAAVLTWSAVVQVKRAPGLPKLKKFVSDRPQLFELDEVSGLLSLKK